MDNVVFWIVVWAAAGLLAKAVHRGEGPAGAVGDVVVGVAGAMIGGSLFNRFLGHWFEGWIASAAVAFVGAVASLALVRAATYRRGAWH